MSFLLDRIEQSIRARGLFQRGERILVAVSGGLDSMVLLHLLHRLSTKHNWKLAVAHFNHQLRGRSSDADEQLVQKTAGRLKLKFVSDRADVKKIAKTNYLSIEMAARQLRHEFLARAARGLEIKTIAMAHHSDDQVELFFLRLLRGAGPEGLSGMVWKSKSPKDPAIQLVRPLLDQQKRFLVEFAKAEKIRFREDASNASLDFQRNRIRHEVLPLLRDLQPAVSETVLRAMEIAGLESDFISQAALDWLAEKKRMPFGQLHVAVQRVCLRLQLRMLRLVACFDLVEQLRLQPKRVVTVNAKSAVYRDLAGIIHPRLKEILSFDDIETEVDLANTNKIQLSQRKIFWSFQNRKGDSFQRKANCEWFDARKVGARILLRHWRKGDRFQPIGANASRKLQDMFTNQKIPQDERHQRIVATTEHGEIFWVEGLRISERFKLDNQSARRLKWQWQRL